MTRNLIAMLVVAGGLTPAMFGQQYPPQNQRDPNYNGQYGNGQYAGPNDDDYDDNDEYDYDDQGVIPGGQLRIAGNFLHRVCPAIGQHLLAVNEGPRAVIRH